MSLPQRKHVRLDGEVYRVPGTTCSITIAVKDRRRCFEIARLANAAIDVLRTHAAARDVDVHAYCFMPDHVHLLISSPTGSDLVSFVGEVKNLIQRRLWTLGVVGAMWQKGFYDHFLRKEETVEVVVDYILNNPVRAGIVEEWRQYPFSGSFAYEL